jgi:hypothetical protein
MILKSIIFSICIIVSINAISQDTVQQSFIETINFISWNNELSLNSSSRYLEHENEKILIQSLNTENKIEWELIKTNSNQYQYNEYELLIEEENSIKKTPRRVKSGYLILSKNSYPVDSFVSFDVSSFEERLMINTERKLIKHGKWFEWIGEYRYNGNYKIDKKDGKWSCRNYRTEEWYEITYKDGVELSKWNKNFAFQPNKDTLEKYLAGNWRFIYEKNKISHYKKNKGSISVEFNKNGKYIKVIKCGFSGYKPPNIDWYISDENHLILENNEGYIEYKVKKMTLSEMILEQISLRD